MEQGQPDRRLLSREQVRKLDARAIDDLGITGLQLMENAGRGLADLLEAHTDAGPVVICCGSGNNGGDGLVLARHLDGRGWDVEVFLWAPFDRLAADAQHNAKILRRTPIPLHVLESPEQTAAMLDRLARRLQAAHVAVDALLGTGARGNPRPPARDVIRMLNDAPLQRLAVDLPSGLDADTGTPGSPTFRADWTGSLAAAKPGLLIDKARPYVGRLHVIDLGIPQCLWDALEHEAPPPSSPPPTAP